MNPTDITDKLFAEFLGLLRNDIINALQAKDKDTTGQTAKQITIITDGPRAALELPGYIQLLERGRGPTSAGAPAGNPPMIERIQLWCRANGIPDKAIWAIKKSIDKKGFKGIPGLVSEPLGEANIKLRLNPIAEAVADALTQQIAELVK